MEHGSIALGCHGMYLRSELHSGSSKRVVLRRVLLNRTSLRLATE
jgi:hypothetical protein